jgi:ethanolamine ammonia-lyase large subunit
MRGQKLDMAKLVSENSYKVALGNAGMNARGDKVASSGTVLQTREQFLMSDYNVSNPKAVRQMGLNDIRQEALSPQEAAKVVRTINDQKQQNKLMRRKITDSEV